MVKRFLISVRERVVRIALSLYYVFLYKKNHRKYVVIGNKQVGIGNRIIDLANIYTWAGKENITLEWTLDEWVGTPFDELFVMSDAPGFKSVSKPRHWWSRQINVPSLPEGRAPFWQLWAPPAWDQGGPTGKSGGRLFMAYNDTPQWAIDLYGEFFKQLKPSQAVQKRIDSISLPDDVVCVMIRNSRRKGDSAGVSKPEKFFAAMRACGKAKFFVSCMDKEMSDLVRSEFPGQILELPDKNYVSLVDATADMWLLGQGKELIVQNGSTFAEVGWWWRGCKAKVTKIMKDYVQEV